MPIQFKGRIAEIKKIYSVQWKIQNIQISQGGKCFTSQFDLEGTQAVYQVPFSFSHQAPSDACKAPRLQYCACTVRGTHKKKLFYQEKSNKVAKTRSIKQR